MDTSFGAVASQAVGDPEAVILDVRTDAEWAAAHATNAVHWDLARLKAGEMPDIPKGKHLYVHCAAGARAGQAKTILESNGWTSVQNMGGLNDWNKAGGAIVH